MSRYAERRLRVTHVTLGLEVGGQEKLLVEFARHADAARFELHVISMGDRGKLAAEIEAHGGRIVALVEPPGVRPRLVWRLAQWFRRLRSDVVHLHDDKPLLYGALAARLAGVPHVIYTQHHGRLASQSRRHERLVGLASRSVDRIVCVSHAAARHLIAQGAPARHVRVLWNGIDLKRFPCTRAPVNGPIVTVARLSPEKDLGTLLQAMAVVTRVDPNTRLEIAGDGPCRESLSALMRDLNLGEHVQFLGETPDVPRLLARAGMFVLPSQSEGLSLTLLEAMASGLPVVATNVGGNAEIVEDGVSGLLVPPRQPRIMAEAILWLRRNVAACEQMGQAGRRRAEQDFDVRMMVARYEALYLRQGNGDWPHLEKTASGEEVQPCVW
jgi:glycosyltransferase involved in cell wall biosynthesis